MSLVVDSSAALSWIYRDERNSAASHLLERATQSEIWVPAIWHLEIANSLQLSVRRGRVDARFRDESLADLERLDVRVDGETHMSAWRETLQLAARFRLTLYDASYLELARRRRLPLATRDRELRAAGSAVEIELLGA